MTSVKRVNLETLAKIQPSYRNADGVYNADTDTIYIHAGLPKQGVHSHGAVLAHERGHALIEKTGLKTCFPNGYEEQFCWLYALATAPKDSLTGCELVCRKIMFRNRTWSRKADRHAIMEAILILCQVQPNRGLIVQLSGIP